MSIIYFEFLLYKNIFYLNIYIFNTFLNFKINLITTKYLISFISRQLFEIVKIYLKKCNQCLKNVKL